MNIGYAFQAITPESGLTLCGFAARCNAPSTDIDDPLQVHVMVIEAGESAVLLMVFDLLALGPAFTTLLHEAFDQAAFPIPRERRLFCATHTHSAPAAITLIGCGVEHREYWRFVIHRAVEAAQEAYQHKRPARLRIAKVPLVGANYNRRCLLEDGRVVMTKDPLLPIRKCGPNWDELMLLRFDDAAGDGIAGIVHWAAHPITQGTLHITADYPGELRRRFSAQFEMPFLFLQGACANLNTTRMIVERPEMLRFVDGIMQSVEEVRWDEPVDVSDCRFATATTSLPYAPVADLPDLQQFCQSMATLAATGNAPEETIAILCNVLNIAPGESADPQTLRYFARCMKEWSGTILKRQGALPSACEITLHAMRLGPLVLCGVAAEPFVETAIALKDACPEDTCMLIGYAAPLVGYLPTDEAMHEGGYEVDSAYRFYAHPAPFAPGAEGLVREALIILIQQTRASTTHCRERNEL